MESVNKPVTTLTTELTDLPNLKKLHAQMAFVHQILTQSTRYDVNEFEIAKDAIRTITNQANALSEQIKSLTPPPPPEEPKTAVEFIPPEVAQNE